MVEGVDNVQTVLGVGAVSGRAGARWAAATAFGYFLSKNKRQFSEDCDQILLFIELMRS